MYNSIHEEDSEISIRELIEVLLDHKILIGLIVFASIVLVSIYTFAFTNETYESSIVLNISNVTENEISTDQIGDLVDLQKYYPSANVLTYMEQIKAPEVLQGVIDSLGLQNSEGDPISKKSLSNRITVVNPTDTKLITILVTDTDAAQAAAIANALGDEFIQFINNNNRVQSQYAANLIQGQLVLEEANLQEKSLAVASYLANSESISELKASVANYENLINSYKASVLNLEASIEINLANLNTLLGVSDLVTLETLESIQFDMNMKGELSIGDLEISTLEDNDIQKALLTMEITNLQTELIRSISQKAIYESKLEEYKLSLIEERNTLAEKEYKYNSLNRELDLANQTYTAYQQRHKEAVILAAANIGSSGISISSRAFVPIDPVGPGVMLNFAIAIILGLMIGCFIAFFKAYWVRTSSNG